MNVLINLQQLVLAWQLLQSIAPVIHIDSEDNYIQAIALLNSLLDIVRDDTQHPLYSLVSVIGDLIEAYEINQEPLTS